MLAPLLATFLPFAFAGVTGAIFLISYPGLQDVTPLSEGAGGTVVDVVGVVGVLGGFGATLAFVWFALSEAGFNGFGKMWSRTSWPGAYHVRGTGGGGGVAAALFLGSLALTLPLMGVLPFGAVVSFFFKPVVGICRGAAGAVCELIIVREGLIALSCCTVPFSTPAVLATAGCSSAKQIRLQKQAAN